MKEQSDKAGKSTQAGSTEQPKSRKGIGGPKPKPEAQKAKYAVGSFYLTMAEKQAYDKLFEQSGLSSQTTFFKNLVFDGRLKLYYSDANTSLVYKELLRIKNEISAIGRLYNQAVARVNSESGDQSLYGSLQELKVLHGQVLALVSEMGGQVEALKGAMEEREKGER